jgi:hypothetical protein
MTHVLMLKRKAWPQICFSLCLVEAILKQIHFKAMAMQIDLFKFIDINVNTVVFHSKG